VKNFELPDKSGTLEENMETQKVTVNIISQQSLFRRVSSIPFRRFGYRSSGTAEINENVLTTMDNLPPDVALMDIDGSAETGLRWPARSNSFTQYCHRILAPIPATSSYLKV